jgi:outer membrane protein OmpA-like peptidoglycan-associated protein
MRKEIISATALTAILLFSCNTTKVDIARVRISQPDMIQKDDTASLQMPQQIKWTDEKGLQHIVVQAEKDSVTGEDITTVQLSEVTVTARSKQIAERNGKINLDFIITVPASLINKKWQLQLTPAAYMQKDSILLDKILLSGADFAKMQKKGYAQYQAFIASIIPDSLYLQELFDEKGYKKALEEIEQEYYQAWSGEFLLQDQWIDWKEKTNLRYAFFNHKLDRNKRKIEGTKTPLSMLPAYWLYRDMEVDFVPERYKLFVDGNYQIKLKKITPEDSVKIADKYFNFKRMAENQRKKEMVGEMYNKYVRFPYQPARLDTVIRSGDKFIYYYDQELPATEQTKKIDLTLHGQILSRDQRSHTLPNSDTLTYYVSSMVQFLDHSPRYKKKIISRKDEVNVTAYINYKTGTTSFDETLGQNKAELDKVNATIRDINYTGEFLIDSIKMTATSSQEGSAYMNLQLSKERAINLKKYLLSKSDDPEGVDSLFRPRWIGEDWETLRSLIEKDDTLQHKYDLLGCISDIENLDLRENTMKKYKSDYIRLRDKHYPLLRAVKFKFHLHRRDMIQDTIIVPVIDSTYMDAIKMIEERKYKQALVLLDDMYPDDYNTAICLMSLGYDKRALDIMLQQADTSDRNYILAILYVRLKQEELAVKSFIKSCDQDETKIWRGKLDPEINTLIKTYNLYQNEY